MQINFYMAEKDKAIFHDYIFQRNGYIMPETWPTRDVPIYSEHSPVPEDRADLKIFREDLFNKVNFCDQDWITPYPQFDSYFVHGPGMQYSPSWIDTAGLHRGRIYMGLVSPGSFLKPDMPYACVGEEERDSYRKLENFYKSCCRFIRKRYRKASTGFYHGPFSDIAEASGVVKVLNL